MPDLKCDVEVIIQAQNPICWVASCAMARGNGTKSSAGVGDLTQGFDPSNSCIANLATTWSQRTDAMAGWGFTVSAVGDVASGGMTADTLWSTVQSNGPVVLLHSCSGFSYGSQHASMTFDPDDRHAVVIIGVDTDASTATCDNPWGDKDQSCDLATLIQRINAGQTLGKTLGFWPAPNALQWID